MSKGEMQNKANAIISEILGISDFSKRYDGILICEGTNSSLDWKLYQAVYPCLKVYPAGGWSQVIQVVQIIRRKLKPLRVFGIIDRDSRSKGEIKELRNKEKIYCTKLPFIENIISSPEVLQVLTQEKNFGNPNALEEIQKKLLHILSRRLRDALPINLPIREDEGLEAITIRIKKSNGVILEKTVDATNIMYAYRAKAVVNEVSDALQIVGRRNYYQLFLRYLEDPKVRLKLIKCVMGFLPEIVIERNDIDELGEL